MRKTDKIILTPQQERWLVRHFKHTKNDEIQSRLGISQKTLHRFARKLGLTKSKQFMKKCQDAAITAANKANRQNGWPPKGYVIPRSEEFRFKEGVSNVKRLGAKREAERIAKSAESMRKTMKMERIRINFGLPLRKLGEFLHKPVQLKRRKVQEKLNTENIPTQKDYERLLD